MKPKGKAFWKIVRMLRDNVPYKQIAHATDVPYETVVTISHRFFKTVRKQVREVFDPDQLKLPF